MLGVHRSVRSGTQNGCVQGFGDDTYGEAFADVYDEWYGDLGDVASCVAALSRLAGDRGTVVELGVGTGRLAIPLAAAGLHVWGIDTSAAMLARLADKPGGRAVRTVHGDMVEALASVEGPIDVVVVAYNTLFSLTTAERQGACFTAVADRLADAGVFVIEAFVPAEDDDAPSSRVAVRSLSADRVVLSVDRTHRADQIAEGQHIELTEAHGVRLRPWRIRWATPAQLDAMATRAGLRLAERWSDFAGTPFDRTSARHVSVYRHADNPPTVRPQPGDAS